MAYLVKCVRCTFTKRIDPGYEPLELSRNCDFGFEYACKYCDSECTRVPVKGVEPLLLRV